jgi:NADH-quinone oxidoreductase subunit L
MFLAMGVGAYAAGVFHLYTHAFFKALLFLGSGAVIHALAGEQDLRKMGGLKKDLPITYWTFLIGALAIAGVPGLAGFFSKDEILFRTFSTGHTMLWVVGLLTSLLTAIYMFRIVFLAFHGERAEQAPPLRDAHAVSSHTEPPPVVGADLGPPSGHHAHDVHRHLHDAPPAMAIVLIVLAVGSVVAGYAGLPSILGGGDWFARYLEPSFGVAPVEEIAEHGLEGTLMLVSIAAAIAGIGVAFYFFLKNRRSAGALADRFSGVQTLLLNKYYVDEVYDAAIVQPIRIVSDEGLWRVFDVKLIDAAVNGVGQTVAGSSEGVRRLQTGSVRAYAVSVVFGVVAILGYYLWR